MSAPATLESIQESINELKKSGENKKWQLVTIILPVVLTTILGALGFFWQQRIQTNFDQKAKELSSKLALAEEYFKRQLDVYQEVHKHMILTQSALRDLKTGAGAATQVNHHLTQLSQARAVNTIYISREASEKLGDLFLAVVTDPVLRGNRAGDMDAVDTLVHDAENLIMRDLHIDELRGFRSGRP